MLRPASAHPCVMESPIITRSTLPWRVRARICSCRAAHQDSACGTGITAAGSRPWVRARPGRARTIPKVTTRRTRGLRGCVLWLLESMVRCTMDGETERCYFGRPAPYLRRVSNDGASVWHECAGFMRTRGEEPRGPAPWPLRVPVMAEGESPKLQPVTSE